MASWFDSKLGNSYENESIYYMKNNKTIWAVIGVIVVGFGLYEWKKGPAVPPGPQATYANATKNDIESYLPFPGAVTDKAFTMKGQARGTWYFEGSFPAAVLGQDGSVIWSGPVQADGEWMTEEFVPFTGQVSVPKEYTGPATVVMKKDNPSGEPANDASLSFPITIQ